MVSRLQNAETYQIDLSSSFHAASICHAFDFPSDAVACYASTIDELKGKIDGKQLFGMASRMIELEPNAGDGYLARATLAFETGLWDHIESDIETLMSIGPEDVESIGCAADYYFNTAQHDKAVGFIEKLIKLDPESPSLHSMYGQSLFELGQFERAEAELLPVVDKLQKNAYLRGWTHSTWLNSTCGGMTLAALSVIWTKACVPA